MLGNIVSNELFHRFLTFHSLVLLGAIVVIENGDFLYLLRGTLSSLLGHLTDNEYSSEWSPKERNSDFAGLMIAQFLG